MNNKRTRGTGNPSQDASECEGKQTINSLARQHQSQILYTNIYLTKNESGNGKTKRKETTFNEENGI